MPTTTSDWDPLSPAAATDPRTEHDRLQRECPVAHSDQFGGVWAVFRHADISRVANDPATFSATPAFTVPDMTGGVLPWLPVQSDPPVHAAYRALITPFFRGQRLAQIEPELRRITHARLDAALAAGQVDVASEVSFPVSTSALALLMGLPAEEGAQFARWHYAMVDANAREDAAALDKTFQEMLGFVTEWIALRRAEPNEDLMSALCQGEVDGRPLTDEEIIGTFILLMVGGYETSADVLSATLRHLSTEPETCEQLRSSPRTMSRAIGEFIRVFAPVQGTARTTTREVEIGDRRIPAGERVLLMWAAGSRDEDVFEAPDTCNVERHTGDMLSFGAGDHRCAGEPLARITIRAVLEAWLERVDTFEVAGDPQPSVWPTLGWNTMPMHVTGR